MTEVVVSSSPCAFPTWYSSVASYCPLGKSPRSFQVVCKILPTCFPLQRHPTSFSTSPAMLPLVHAWGELSVVLACFMLHLQGKFKDNFLREAIPNLP